MIRKTKEFIMFKKSFFMTALLWAMTCAAPLMAATVYIPHLTGEDAGWVDYLLVDNYGLSQSEFTVKLYRDGSEIYNTRHSADRLGRTTLRIKDLADGAQCGVVEYSSEALQFRAAYEYSAGAGGVAEFALPRSVTPALAFRFSGYSSMVSWKGLALTNFGSSSSSVNLYAVGQGGILGSTSIDLGAKARVRGLYATWFPSVHFSDITSVVAVTTGTSISGIAISGDNDNGKLLFTTAVGLDSFDPGDIPVPGADDVAGTWEGQWVSTSYPGETDSLTFHLSQSGTGVSRTADLIGTDCGDLYGVPLSGTFDGTTLSLDGSYTCQGVTATVKYTKAVVSGSSMAGVYTLYAGGVPYDVGTFKADRE